MTRALNEYQTGIRDTRGKMFLVFRWKEKAISACYDKCRHLDFPETVYHRPTLGQLAVTKDEGRRSHLWYVTQDKAWIMVGRLMLLS